MDPSDGVQRLIVLLEGRAVWTALVEEMALELEVHGDAGGVAAVAERAKGAAWQERATPVVRDVVRAWLWEAVVSPLERLPVEARGAALGLVGAMARAAVADLFGDDDEDLEVDDDG